MLGNGSSSIRRRKRDRVTTVGMTVFSTVAILCLCGMLDSPFVSQPTNVQSPSTVMAADPARRFNTQKPILMLHIRKTGGTTLCAAAMEYNRGEWRLPADLDRRHNCNPSAYFWWYYSKPPSVPSQMWCQELYEREIVDRNAAVAFLEFPLHSTLPCEQFRTMVVLREPIARTVSDLLQNSITSLPHALKEYAAWVETGKGPGGSYWKNRFLVDNVYIRTILGTRKYFARGNMTRIDLEEAKTALLGFEWVLFMDEMDDTIGELNSKHGWALEMPSHVRHTGPCASCDLVPCGYCQEGCAPSSCEYEGTKDKLGKRDRNRCGITNGIRNKGIVPEDCRSSSTTKAYDRRLFARMQRVRKQKPAWTKDLKLIQMLRDRNSLDIELYDFARETFAKNKVSPGFS